MVRIVSELLVFWYRAPSNAVTTAIRATEARTYTLRILPCVDICNFL